MELKNNREQDILNDIPRLYERINIAQKSIADYQINIERQHQLKSELEFYIREDKARIKEGRKPRYELEAMKTNIERHDSNIKLFEETIAKEEINIKTLRSMISTLEEDLKKPTEIILDMRGPKAPFRKKGE